MSIQNQTSLVIINKQETSNGGKEERNKNFNNGITLYYFINLLFGGIVLLVSIVLKQ